MFGFGSKLPIEEEARLWVDEGFRRLIQIMGFCRLSEAEVILPTDEFFPDPFSGGAADLQPLFRRVCQYMQIDPDRIRVEIIPDFSDLQELLPAFHYSSRDPAGLYYREDDSEKSLIAIKENQIKDPLLLIATLAHELSHFILLGGGHIDPGLPDMEPLTDLATVFLGMGIFTSNAAFRFVQYQDNYRQGWSTSRQGYLPEVVYGYALARFAQLRGENQPTWTAHLTTNLKVYFRKSAAWLHTHADSVI